MSLTEVDSLDMQTKLLVLCMSFVGFSMMFVGSWFALLNHYPRFRSMTTALKADNCSRVNSQIHSIIVVPGLLAGIIGMQWNDDYHAQGPVATLQTFLCITIGYFACDTVVLLMYRVPQWGVFVVHHIVASTPYVVYLFIAACPVGLFILAMFLLVEATTITLNVQVWLEQADMSSTKLYAACFYTTFVCWIFVRIANPFFLLYVIHAKIVPSVKAAGGEWTCLLPGIVCAWLITAFCTGVFVMILCKEMKMRWQTAPEIEKVARAEDTRLAIDTSQMTQDERDLTMLASPTRMALHEAQEAAHNFEEAVVEKVKSEVKPLLNRRTGSTPTEQ